MTEIWQSWARAFFLTCFPYCVILIKCPYALSCNMYLCIQIIADFTRLHSAYPFGQQNNG